jgi:hypothetical protein
MRNTWSGADWRCFKLFSCSSRRFRRRFLVIIASGLREPRAAEVETSKSKTQRRAPLGLSGECPRYQQVSACTINAVANKISATSTFTWRWVVISPAPYLSGQHASPRLIGRWRHLSSKCRALSLVRPRSHSEAVVSALKDRAPVYHVIAGFCYRKRCVRNPTYSAFGSRPKKPPMLSMSA